MFPEGIITREIKVGPAFDLASGTPFTIRVLIAPTRSAVWAATGDPVVAKLKTYVVQANTTSLIKLPVTDQPGYETGMGESIVLDPGEHAFGYKISMFYLINGSVVKSIPTATIVIPTGVSPIDVDSLVSFTSENSGEVISTPDIWSTQVAAAQSAAIAAEASAAAAEAAVDGLNENIGTAVEEWFEANQSAVVSPDTLDAALTAHKNEPTPHKAYDLDIPSLTVLFENGLA